MIKGSIGGQIEYEDHILEWLADAIISMRSKISVLKKARITILFPTRISYISLISLSRPLR